MLSDIGISLVVLILILSFSIIYISSLDLKTPSRTIKKSIYKLSLFQTTFTILSFFTLIIGFISSDFSLINVYENSHTTKPFFYKIAGTWGNHEGSLLLWVNILVIFSYLFLMYSKSLDTQFRLKFLSIMGFLNLGFLLFLVFTSNPFEKNISIPIDGKDLNPLLQDFGLIIHPPMLYMGYVGLSVVFSFAVTCLLQHDFKKEWAKWIRPWALMSWSFLTLGIALGSWWAYYELGWGGWWFWDPVENASFMPWLITTALIHSLITCEQKSIYHWVIILCLSTFILSVTGTFLVRSGILNSVHTFASDPSRGIYILLFLSLMIFSALIIFFLKHKKETYNLNLKSRETFILTNNWFMTFFLVTVLIGMLYPIFLDVLTNVKISVGPPFFNIVIIPLVVPLMFLMAIGPKFGWIKSKNKVLYKILFLSLWAVIINLVIFYFFGKYSLLSNLIFIAAIFLILFSFLDIKNFINNKNKAELPRIISHLGFGLLVFFIGINHQFSIEEDFNLKCW